MKKDKEIKLIIERQGAPIINDGFIFCKTKISKNKNIALVYVDLKSKWCEIEAEIGGDDEAPALSIGASERSTSLHKGSHIDDDSNIKQYFRNLQDGKYFLVN